MRAQPDLELAIGLSSRSPTGPILLTQLLTYHHLELSTHSIWHSFWHIFWQSILHRFPHSICHKFRHYFWHSIWHVFWHSFRSGISSGIIFGISSGILSGILFGIQSDILFWWTSIWHLFWHQKYVLACVRVRAPVRAQPDLELAIGLSSRSPTGPILLTQLLTYHHLELSTHSIWHSFWHIFWQSILHRFPHSICHKFRHYFWHPIWHVFWHSFRSGISSGIIFGISSGILSGILFGIQSDILFWWTSIWHLFWHQKYVLACVRVRACLDCPWTCHEVLEQDCPTWAQTFCEIRVRWCLQWQAGRWRRRRRWRRELHLVKILDILETLTWQVGTKELIMV